MATVDGLGLETIGVRLSSIRAFEWSSIEIVDPFDLHRFVRKDWDR